MYKKSLADLGKKGPEGVGATGTLFLGQQKPVGPRIRELTTTTARVAKTSLTNSRGVLIFIALIPFRSHWQMLANFSQVEFQRTISKFRKRKSLSCVYVLQKNKIRKFCVVVVQRRQRNIQRA